jgi:hypothetical protein
VVVRVVVGWGGVGRVRGRREEEEVREELAAVRRHVGSGRDAHAPQDALHLKVHVRRRHPALLERRRLGGGAVAAAGRVAAAVVVVAADGRPQPRDAAEDADARVVCVGSGASQQHGGRMGCARGRMRTVLHMAR